MFWRLHHSLFVGLVFQSLLRHFIGDFFQFSDQRTPAYPNQDVFRQGEEVRAVRTAILRNGEAEGVTVFKVDVDLTDFQNGAGGIKVVFLGILDLKIQKNW